MGSVEARFLSLGELAGTLGGVERNRYRGTIELIGECGPA